MTPCSRFRATRILQPGRGICRPRVPGPAPSRGRARRVRGPQPDSSAGFGAGRPRRQHARLHLHVERVRPPHPARSGRHPECATSGPPSSAPGHTWIAAGTAPDAPDIRPSVTSATRKPLFCSPVSAGVSECSSGMPLARRPLEAHHGHHVAIELARLERRRERRLAFEHRRRRLDAPAIRRHGGDLDHAAAQRSLQQPDAAFDLERLDAPAAGSSCRATSPRAGRHSSLPSLSHGSVV